MLLFGGGSRSSNRLYRFHADGHYDVLFDAPEPIVAVAESRAAVYVATRSALLRLPEQGPPTALRLEEANIVSVAAIADDGMAFFSTPTAVFVWQGGDARPLIEDSGGTLRVRGDTLYVLDRTRAMAYAARPTRVAP
jgi:hypothetical protein